MLSSYESEALRRFYGHASACPELEKVSGWRYSTWTCKKTQKACGPRVCPKEHFSNLLSEKPEVESLLEPQRSEPVKVLPEMGTGGGAQATDREINPKTEKASELNVIHRKRAKTHCGPHVKSGTVVKRVLISFVSKNGELRRWPFDCIFGPRRTPRILEFQGKNQRKNMRDARFYFPIQATNQDVRNLVGSWFVNLKVHDESASLNIMGSPTPYSVDILD